MLRTDHASSTLHYLWLIMNTFSSESVISPFCSCRSFVILILPKQGDTLYMFFENKNPITMQGDIGVAQSTNKGATWKPLGIALDEPWHLSFPFVFNYNDQVRDQFLTSNVPCMIRTHYINIFFCFLYNRYT